MGEVYRARDTKLGREVAIKFLPEGLSDDAARLARFEREAQTLASLNHPNIAQIFGFEDGALVMELLEGAALSALLAEGPLPVRKAIEYGGQIARGLAAAHERGIVHRDLKPDNVFVLKDGHVKVIDFGLAREAARATSGATQTMTMVRPATEPGTVLGTVGYMAPEQVRGETVDARADLFALGVVLYEMLTGGRAFKRDTTAETMTAILREDPQELSTVRPEITPGLERIVRHCLEKNPRERFQTARDVAFALDALAGSGSGSGALAARAEIPARRHWIERGLWATAVVTLAAIGGWLSLGRRAAPATLVPPVYRVTIPLPDGVVFSQVVAPVVRMAISPDARYVVFVGEREVGDRALWLISTDGSPAREIPDTRRSTGPFWSADSKSVAFSVEEDMKKVDVEGGGAVRIGPRGFGRWDASGDILYTTGPSTWTLFRMPRPGEKPVQLLKPATDGERFDLPTVLADGRFILNHATSSSGTLEVRSRDGATVSIVSQMAALVTPQYANGAILYGQGDRIVAQRFDESRLALVAEPVTIAEGVNNQVGAGGSAFSVSATGVLAYQPQQNSGRSRLTWIDRDGRVLSTVGDEADYSNVELSRDERRLAVSVIEADRRTARDIYLVDLTRGVRQRLTFDPSEERSAIWTPDGRQIIYNSKGLELYRRSSDFTGDEEAIRTDQVSKDPRDVSPDGRQLLYRRSANTGGNDIMIMPLDGDRTPRPLVATPFDENYASFSPDGHSVVYVSNESGQPEVYVISLEPGGGKVQVSSAGGTFPRWRNAREIVYLALDQTITSVAVTGSGPSFRAGAVTPLFKVAVQPGPGTPFDVTADGKRFIVNAGVASRFSPSVRLVINWPSLLAAR
jgi:Tol biopolymer transport system component